ncbi:MAG: superoxide dismutase family protein, partial [candidate division Zixibacteria bacterium]|nr:superoxide dismutase family protein [candidate division Zixibacteria bacterium]
SIRHVGDIGNIVADADGKATLEWVDSHMTFEGASSIIGRGVIIHAGEDDLTSQPTGAAGARVACGVIGIAKAE